MQLIKIRSAGGSHISRKCSEEGAASVQRATRSLPPGWKEAPLCAWNPVVGKAVCSQVILIELIYCKQNKPLIADCSFEKKNKGTQTLRQTLTQLYPPHFLVSVFPIFAMHYALSIKIPVLRWQAG